MPQKKVPTAMNFSRLYLPLSLNLVATLIMSCSALQEEKKQQAAAPSGGTAEALSATPSVTPTTETAATPIVPPKPSNLDPSKIVMFVGQQEDFWLFSGPGTPVTGCSASPSLPDGTSLVPEDRNCRLNNTATTPIESATYTIIVAAMDGTTTTRSVDIEVKIPQPPALQTSSPISGYAGALVPVTRMSNTGEDAVICWSVPRLPEGLQVKTVDGTCEISGRALAISPQSQYRISANAVDGSRSSAMVEITILDGALSAYCPKLADHPARVISPILRMNPITFTNNGPAAESCAVTPPLPDGLSVAPYINSCRISGSPTIAAPMRIYTVSATGSDGTTDTAAVTLTVSSDLEPILANAGSIHLASGVSALARQIRFDNTGGAVTSCDSNPALPSPLKVLVSNGTCVISGVAFGTQAPVTYTVTGRNATGKTANATVTLSFSPPPTPNILVINGTFTSRIKKISSSSQVNPIPCISCTMAGW